MFAINKIVARRRILAEMASCEEEFFEEEEDFLNILPSRHDNILISPEPSTSLMTTSAPAGLTVGGSPDPPPSSTSLLPSSAAKRLQYQRLSLVQKLARPEILRSPTIPGSSNQIYSLLQSSQQETITEDPEEGPKIRLPLTKMGHKALKVTWKKIMSISLTSGMGVITSMERVFEKMIEQKPKVKTFFFKAAFVSAMGKGRFEKSQSITTIRDHAKLLVTLIDKMINQLDTRNLIDDPSNYGTQHICLKHFGFRSADWELFGQCLAEVMFMQECVRAFPDAPKAWITIIAAMIDSMRYAFEKHHRKRTTTNQPPPPSRNRSIVPPRTSLSCHNVCQIEENSNQQPNVNPQQQLHGNTTQQPASDRNANEQPYFAKCYNQHQTVNRTTTQQPISDGNTTPQQTWNGNGNQQLALNGNANEKPPFPKGTIQQKTFHRNMTQQPISTSNGNANQQLALSRNTNEQPPFSKCTNQQPPFHRNANQPQTFHRNANQPQTFHRNANQQPPLSRNAIQQPTLTRNANEQPPFPKCTNEQPTLHRNLNQPQMFHINTNMQPHLSGNTNQQPHLHRNTNRRLHLYRNPNQRQHLHRNTNQQQPVHRNTDQQPNLRGKQSTFDLVHLPRDRWDVPQIRITQV